MEDDAAAKRQGIDRKQERSVLRLRKGNALERLLQRDLVPVPEGGDHGLGEVDDGAEQKGAGVFFIRKLPPGLKVADKRGLHRVLRILPVPADGKGHPVQVFLAVPGQFFRVWFHKQLLSPIGAAVGGIGKKAAVCCRRFLRDPSE